MTSFKQDCPRGCYKSCPDTGKLIIKECCENVGAIRVAPDWRDITPTNRHGDVVDLIDFRDSANGGIVDSLIHCVVIQREDNVDVAEVLWMSTDDIPVTALKHGTISACLNSSVMETIKTDAFTGESSKILFFEDKSEWTENTAQALSLLLHAKLKRAGSARTPKFEESEALANKYCRNMGIERHELAVVNTCGSPSRISRSEVEEVKNQESKRHELGTRKILHNEDFLQRQDSQTPLRVDPADLVKEYGGLEGTFRVTRDGRRRRMSHAWDSDDFHPLTEDGRSVAGASRKSRRRRPSQMFATKEEKYNLHTTETLQNPVQSVKLMSN